MINTLPAFLAYFFSSMILLMAALAAYVMITPYNEIRLIRSGNTAASIGFGGTIIGMVIPMCSAIAHSVGFTDMLVWSIIGLAIQLGMWTVIHRVFGDLQIEIAKNECMSHAVILASSSIAIGMIEAACMTW
jgi:putative membrane protein